MVDYNPICHLHTVTALLVDTGWFIGGNISLFFFTRVHISSEKKTPESLSPYFKELGCTVPALKARRLPLFPLKYTLSQFPLQMLAWAHHLTTQASLPWLSWALQKNNLCYRSMLLYLFSLSLFSSFSLALYFLSFARSFSLLSFIVFLVMF